ncbi:MAG TPA: hypothetical protein VG496_03820 [Myxococcales bacterium]|nr:hypothetical protein [Myxococcales bacterium]
MNHRRDARTRDARRWFRYAAGAAAVAAARAGPARAACYGGDYHSAAAGIHLGIAFGGPGLPIKLNYGITGRFGGHDTAAIVRFEAFGLSALQLTTGITQQLGQSVFVEGGGTGTIGAGGKAAGFHAGFGPGDSGGGLLIGGSLPLVGERQFKYVQLAPFVYPSNVCVPSGRALRVTDGNALPPVLAVDCAPIDETLASAWLDDARAEFASVPAFLRLAAELTAAGAPLELRGAALAAAHDERHHALAAFAMASRWAHSPFAVQPLDAQPRFDRPSESVLRQLAIEAWQDGCLGEGAAALCARFGLARVRDEQARQVLARIAPDEERHAELSWSILAWCCKTGDASVRDTVAEVARSPAPMPASREEDAEWLSYNGRLTTAERNCARAQLTEHARRRLDAIVGLFPRRREFVSGARLDRS